MSLKLADRSTDRRLSNLQRFGGTSQAAMLRCCDNKLKMP
jgi:hypothetical protein